MFIEEGQTLQVYYLMKRQGFLVQHNNSFIEVPYTD